MLQIHVVFTGDSKRIAKQFFREELDKMIAEHFICFTESHYTLCHITDTEFIICIDLSIKYSMLFASKVSEISSGIESMFVQSVNYSL